MIDAAQVSFRVIVVHSHPVTQEEEQSVALVTGVKWDLPQRQQYVDVVAFPNRCGQQLYHDAPVRDCPDTALAEYRIAKQPQVFMIPGVV